MHQGIEEIVNGADGGDGDENEVGKRFYKTHRPEKIESWSRSLEDHFSDQDRNEPETENKGNITQERNRTAFSEKEVCNENMENRNKENNSGKHFEKHTFTNTTSLFIRQLKNVRRD